MNQVVKQVEDSFKAKKVTDVRSGDTVKVFQKIKEGGKERIQVFEGLVINRRRNGSKTFTITVRRIASGVGVEKTFQPHSPLIEKIEVVKRSKVRRNKLVFMRGLSGKSARLSNLDFDKLAVNFVPDVEDKSAPKTAEELVTPEISDEEAQPNENTQEVKEPEEAEPTKEEPKADKNADTK